MDKHRRVPFATVILPSSTYGTCANDWKRWFGAKLNVMRPSLAPIFDAYMDTYKRAEEMSVEFSELGRDFDRGLTKNYGDNLLATVESVRTVRVTTESLASSLLLALDGSLRDLRIRMNGKSDRCTGDGPELRHGVTVDRALDAAGNYARHGHEWLMHDYRETWPEGRQLSSIQVLAQLRTARPTDDNREAYMEFTLTNPPLLVMDLLCDFEERGYESSYDAVQAKISAAAECTIERLLSK